MHSNHRGFIALFSVLIISAVLITLSISASTIAWLVRDAAEDESSYRASIEAGWSCTYLALNRLSANPDRFKYESATLVHLSTTETCSIFMASSTETTADVYVQGHVRNSFVDMYITARRASSTAPLFVDTWRIN